MRDAHGMHEQTFASAARDAGSHDDDLDLIFNHIRQAELRMRTRLPQRLAQGLARRSRALLDAVLALGRR